MRTNTCWTGAASFVSTKPSTPKNQHLTPFNTGALKELVFKAGQCLALIHGPSPPGEKKPVDAPSISHKQCDTTGGRNEEENIDQETDQEFRCGRTLYSSQDSLIDSLTGPR